MSARVSLSLGRSGNGIIDGGREGVLGASLYSTRRARFSHRGHPAGQFQPLHGVGYTPGSITSHHTRPNGVGTRCD